MQEVIEIKSLPDLLNNIVEHEWLGHGIRLYRGQTQNSEIWPLLPSIARNGIKFHEKQMLDDFKRESQLLIREKITSDWEWLFYAQHFGLKTRLLDWTSNPLVALWFACQEKSTCPVLKADPYHYVFELACEKNMLMNLSVDKKEPFDISETKIIRPVLNNKRIIAQSGWFTVHHLLDDKKSFKKIDSEIDKLATLRTYKLPIDLKDEILISLAKCGITAKIVYGDLEGVSKFLNWKYAKELDTNHWLFTD